MRGLLILILFATACGSDPTPPATNACGLVGAPVAQECTGLNSCGAGDSNFVKVAFCEHCFARGDSHLCEAGACRAVGGIDALGTIRAAFSLQAAGAAKGLTQASLIPLMSDGTKLTCSALLSTCGWPNNPAINAPLSNFQDLPAGDSAVALISAVPGPEALYFVTLTSERQGRGSIVARGCAEGISVTAGQTTEVEVNLVGP